MQKNQKAIYGLSPMSVDTLAQGSREESLILKDGFANGEAASGFENADKFA
jgi:hypothetical protein